jgi:hypothetical protein
MTAPAPGSIGICASFPGQTAVSGVKRTNLESNDDEGIDAGWLAILNELVPKR